MGCTDLIMIVINIESDVQGTFGYRFDSSQMEMLVPFLALLLAMFGRHMSLTN